MMVVSETRTFFTMAAIGLLLTSIWGVTEAGQSTDQTKAIAGWVERVSFPGKDFQVKAKLDTGAKTSSIYATDIELFTRNKEDWVSFVLVLPGTDNKLHKLKMKQPVERRVKIKNRNGGHDSRPVVNLGLCFNGSGHVAEFSLTDRKKFIYPVLLGRKFLSEVALVDSEHTFLTREGCSSS